MYPVSPQKREILNQKCSRKFIWFFRGEETSIGQKEGCSKRNKPDFEYSEVIDYS
jgi:hypothetical protein